MDSRVVNLRNELRDPLPHPDPAKLRELTDSLSEWMIQYHATLPSHSIGHNPTRSQTEALLGESAPEHAMDFGAVMEEFTFNVAPHAFRVNHPRFFAFIPGAPSIYSVLGDMLCAGTNFFAGVWLEGAGPAQVEINVLRWFRDILGMPEPTRGLLTSGGSEANLIALVVARQPLAFNDRARAVCYLSAHRHASIDRAAMVIGLDRDQLRPIRSDSHFRLDPAALETSIISDRARGLLPWLVVANAGATNTGTVDQLGDIADVCVRQRLWLHVDAAYGWPAALIAEGRDELRGIERADSVTLDPHKWFAQTFEAGCLLVRDGQRLPVTFGNRPDYLQDVLPAEDEVNFADFGIALTRRFRALKIWLSVKVLGLAWHRQMIERTFRLAEYAQLLLEQSGRFEILCPRQLSIVCFRYFPPPPKRSNAELDEINIALIDELRRTGRAFLSSTRLNGRVALRLCFVNWRTSAADVEEVTDLLAKHGATVSTGEGIDE
jgi:glutamate/tyrosine decarboxylase-like PLP-dependent enzyme